MYCGSDVFSNNGLTDIVVTEDLINMILSGLVKSGKLTNHDCKEEWFIMAVAIIVCYVIINTIVQFLLNIVLESRTDIDCYLMLAD